MQNLSFSLISISIFLCLEIANTSFATELEVTHWWTSGGEAKAVETIQQSGQSHEYIYTLFLGLTASGPQHGI